MKNNIFRAFQEKPFSLLWMSEVFTQISVNLFNFLLIILVYQLTHSNSAVAGIVISFTIPAVLFGTLAGVLVDRWNKKSVLVYTNLFRALLLFILAFFTGNVVVIFIISFLFALITQFFIPAETPIIPLLVRQKLLLSANALFGLGIFGSILLSYVLSGPALLLLGRVKTIIGLGIFLVLGALLVAFIKIPKSQQQKSRQKNILTGLNFTQDIKHVIMLLLRTREVSNSILLLAMSQVLILILASITPGYASQVLGMNVENFPLLFLTPASLGVVAGAIIVVNFFHDSPKEKIVTFGLLLAGLAMAVLPYGSELASREIIQTINETVPQFFRISNVHILIVLAFLLGVANALVFVPSNTILQEKTSDEFRGKVYGILNTLVGVLSFFPIILIGRLSDILGVGRVIVGIGLSLFTVGIMRLFLR